MTRNSTPSNSAKLTPKQRSIVRTALATGATLMMLISAQLFASGTGASTTSTTQSAVLVPTVQPTTSTVRNFGDDDGQITLTSNQSGTIFNTQTQPIPSTHSSR